MTAPIRLALVGLGKIAHEQHLPAIVAGADFVLTATVSRQSVTLDGVPHFRTIDALLESGPPVDAVALCTPPQVRRAMAARALAAGLDVFLEKPPGATVAEVAALERLATDHGAVLFASWHSRHAGGVEPARAWLADKQLLGGGVVWREDVNRWHPGQAWIWEPGGLGVFDPGINALSILSRILPRPLYVASAELSYPANRQAPIAADLILRDTGDIAFEVNVDWRETGPQRWDIVIETDVGRCALSDGGATLTLPGSEERFGDREYVQLYDRFAALIRARARDVDVTPLQLTADAFLIGSRTVVAPFDVEAQG